MQITKLKYYKTITIQYDNLIKTIKEQYVNFWPYIMSSINNSLIHIYNRSLFGIDKNYIINKIRFKLCFGFKIV